VVGVSWQDILPWLTSAMTLWAVWLSAHNLRLSWKVSLTNQALWCGFVVTSGAWGLLPLTLSLAAIFARHLAQPLTAPGAQVLERRAAPDVAAATCDLERFSESGGPAPSPRVPRSSPSPCSSASTPTSSAKDDLRSPAQCA
jgi:hypothetical protein